MHSTAVGYAAGHSPNPSYEEVCSGRTGHTEVVRVAFDPEQISYGNLLKAFWEKFSSSISSRRQAGWERNTGTMP